MPLKRFSGGLRVFIFAKFHYKLSVKKKKTIRYESIVFFVLIVIMILKCSNIYGNL